MSQNNPFPTFQFTVKCFGLEATFQEVSGLEQETQIIEYRGSSSPTFSTVKMPGLSKFGKVTMKRGVFPNDPAFWEAFNSMNMNTIKRHPVEITLLDENGAPQMAWTLNNAWPTKISGVSEESEGNEIVVESVEIAFESLLISAP